MSCSCTIAAQNIHWSFASSYTQSYMQDFVEDFVFVAAHSEIVRYTRGEGVSSPVAKAGTHEVCMHACRVVVFTRLSCRILVKPICAGVYVYICIICIHTHKYTDTYIHTHAYFHVIQREYDTYVCMYVCIYIYIYMHTHRHNWLTWVYITYSHAMI